MATTDLKIYNGLTWDTPSQISVFDSNTSSFVNATNVFVYTGGVWTQVWPSQTINTETIIVPDFILTGGTSGGDIYFANLQYNTWSKMAGPSAGNGHTITNTQRDGGALILAHSNSVSVYSDVQGLAANTTAFDPPTLERTHTISSVNINDHCRTYVSGGGVFSYGAYLACDNGTIVKIDRLWNSATDYYPTTAELIANGQITTTSLGIGNNINAFAYALEDSIYSNPGLTNLVGVGDNGTVVFGTTSNPFAPGYSFPSNASYVGEYGIFNIGNTNKLLTTTHMTITGAGYGLYAVAGESGEFGFLSYNTSTQQLSYIQQDLSGLGITGSINKLISVKTASYQSLISGAGVGDNGTFFFVTEDANVYSYSVAIADNFTSISFIWDIVGNYIVYDFFLGGEYGTTERIQIVLDLTQPNPFATMNVVMVNYNNPLRSPTWTSVQRYVPHSGQ